jgi:replicative DNA helicase
MYFENMTDSLDEKTERERKIPYGISYIDDATGGIRKSELIILGAGEGAGKTECAVQIAMNSAKQQRNTFFLALEAYKNEIRDRILFKEICSLYYDGLGYKKRIFYRNWKDGEYNLALKDLTPKAKEKMRMSLSYLNVLYRTNQNFGINELEDAIDMASSPLNPDRAELIIIDHLHYLDTGKDEIKGLKDIVKKLRDLALTHKIPIIALAHLRKADRKSESIIPSIDDFRGTSDITKIATQVILMSPDYSIQDKERLSTFFYIPKFRLDGSIKRFIGRQLFSIKDNSYEEGYEIGYAKSVTKEFEALETNDLPHWATRTK